MKKLLEVITDDDMKTIELSADGELIEKCFGIENLKATDASFRVVTKALVEKIWKEKDTAVSRIIRILSMSEACSCAQPYLQVEEFWTTMMFNFIPHHEKYVDELKKQYGFDAKSVEKPMSFANPEWVELCLNKLMS